MHLKKRKTAWKMHKWLLATGVLLYGLYFSGIVLGWDQQLLKPTAQAQADGQQKLDAPLVASPANIGSTLLLAIGLDSPDIELDFKDIMSNAAAGQNLYAVVYQKLNVQPEKKAFKESAQAFGLTLPEAAAVRDGSPTPFLNIVKTTSPALTQQQATKRVERFRKIYDERLNYYTVQNELIAAYTPTEIFYNEDLSDSGFDLVYDLHVIEQILFQETEPLQYGGEFTGGLPGGKPLSEFQPKGTDKNSIPAAEKYGSTGTGLVSDGSGSADNSGEDDSKAEIDEAEALAASLKNPKSSLKTITDYAQTKALPKSAHGDLLDPTFCANDYNLGLSLLNAPASTGATNLEGFAATLAAASDKDAGDDTEAGDEATAPSAGDSLAEQLFGSDEPKTPEELEEEVKSLSEQFAQVKLAEPANSLKYLGINTEIDNVNLCTGAASTFGSNSAQAALCLEVNFKYKTASAYVPGETCIACEIEQINDDMWNTIKNNLSPNKAPGNIFEAAKCKKSIVSSPNMNVVLMFSPILTPLNDDLINNKDIVGRWNEFKKKFKPGWFSDEYNKRSNSPASKEDQAAVEEDANLKSPYDDASEYAAANSPSLVTQQQLEAEISKIVNASVQQTARQIRDFEEGSTGAEFGEFYRLLAYEMERMQLFFDIYRRTLDEISTQICPAIKGKRDAS